jgi:hypothetical protein
MQPFQRAKSFTPSQTYLYQKNERALTGNLQNRRKKSFLPLPFKCSVSHYLPHFLSSVFKGLRSNWKRNIHNYVQEKRDEEYYGGKQEFGKWPGLGKTL